jgi:hypothetical protein
MNELRVEKGVHKLMIRQKFKARLDWQLFEPHPLSTILGQL